MQIDIAFMTKETVCGVAAIENVCFSQPWSVQAFFDELENPDAVTLAAVCEGTVAGFVNARKILGEVYINNVAVGEPFRRMGIGEKLLAALEEACVPFEFITLEVRKSNLAARALYNKCGYKIVGERKNFYSFPTENAVLMSKYPGHTE